MPDGVVPDPTWQGVMAGAADVFGQSVHQAINAAREETREELQEEVRRARARLNQLAAQVRELSAEESAMRAALKQIPDEITLEPEEIQRQLEFILRLPGVLGLRVEDGIPILHVRTSTVYDGRRYDLGDYEIKIGPCQRRYHPTEVLDIYCTRTGTRPMSYVHYGRYFQKHLYFHGGLNRNGSGDGWFCFGDRADQIKNLLSRGEIAEALHLAIATMNAVNEGHLWEIPDTFVEIREDGGETVTQYETEDGHVPVEPPAPPARERRPRLRFTLRVRV